MGNTTERLRSPESEPVIRSSGNVFAALGIENPDEELAKAKLAHAIRERIGTKGLTQTAAAKLLDTDQSIVSNITRGKLRGFTCDRLLRYLNLLEANICTVIEPDGS